MLAIHHSVAKHPLVKVCSTPADLRGYVVHVQLPMYTRHYLHVIAAYCPPSPQEVRPALQSYISQVSKEVVGAEDCLIAAADWNATVGGTRHRSANATFSPLPLRPDDRTFSHFLQHSDLYPVAHSLLACPTYHGHQQEHTMSDIDDFLVSANLWQSISAAKPCPIELIPSSALSDHEVLSLNIPSMAWPRVHEAMGLGPSAAGKQLVLPMSASVQGKARAALEAELEVDCSLLAERLQGLEEQALALLGTDYSTSNILLQRPQMQGQVSVQDLAADVDVLLDRGLQILLSVCPTKVKAKRIFLPQVVQKQVRKLLITRRLLSLGRSLVFTHLQNKSTGSSIRSACSVTNHNTAKAARAFFHPSVSLLSLLPDFPQDDEVQSWQG